MTRDAASFDALYRDKGDPWDYETSAYEAEKYRRCLALLPRERYRHGLEIGSSIGVMSALLAQRCETLLGLDFAPTAVATARQRGIANARFEVGAVPEDWPEGMWDLIVLSEVLYYLPSEAALERTLACVERGLAPAGDCLVVGYTGTTETRLDAVEVGERLLAALSAARPQHRVLRDAGSAWVAAVFSTDKNQASGVPGGR